MCLRSEERVISRGKIYCLRIAYDLDLLFDFPPPASVLVYFLKRLCYNFVYVAVAGEIL